MRLLVLTLCLSLTLFSLPAAAAGGTPFGEDVVPIQTEELEDVQGEAKHLAVAATAGAVINTTSYLITTPRRSWSIRGAVRHAVAGAVSATMGAAIGR